MKLFLDRIYFLNFKNLPKFSQGQKRIQRLKIINYFFVLALPVIIINDIYLAVTGQQPYTVEKYPLVIFWIVNVFAFWFTKKGWYTISRLIVIFAPLAFMSSYAIMDQIIGEHFLWQPIVLIGLSIIPLMVLDLKKERVWVAFSVVVFFIYLIFHDKIMASGAIDDFAEVYDHLNTTPFIYNTVRILIFIFLISIIYFAIRLNEEQQLINEQINQSLQQATNRLERLNAELEAQRKAIDNSASLIITDGKQRIMTANSIFQSLTGYTEDELTGRKATDLVFQDRDSEYFKMLQITIEQGKVWRGELKISRKEGGYIWMQTAISTINYPGLREKRYLIVMFDITDLKNHEERLQKLNFEKDRILYAVAHDLKNPLLNFRALLEFLKSGKVKDRSEEEEIFRLMSKDTEHATDLIGELLEIGRLEDENYIMEKEPVDINDFLKKSIEPFEKSAKKKDIRIIEKFDTTLDKVPVNQQEFVRVVNNLISNAIKFTPSGGEIVIETKKSEEHLVSVSIADSGIGISDDLLPIIFDKFSKARRKGIEGEKSTGLGMWIVKHIVKLHGGKIHVESAENQGTTFTITLPA